MVLNDIIDKYPVEEIEKALIFHYLDVNGIDKSIHPYIKDYISSFHFNQSLLDDVFSLEYKSLEELAVCMELLIPKEDRQTNGAFFTPHHIVDYIIDNISPKADAKVIDISCGCGAFILGAIKYFEKKYNKTVSSIVSENIYGVDLLDNNVKRCKLLILLYGLSKGEIIKENEIHIDIDNSLTRKWDKKYDAVIGNPPYVKFQDMEDNTRMLLDGKYNTTSFGTYNLYFAFFEIGKMILAPNGMLGYITPNNYFTSLAGESLRAYFQTTKAISKIVDFNATKVFDVQTYTAITFLTNEANNFIQYARISGNESVEKFLMTAKFTRNSYNDLDTKKWRLLCDNEREVIRRLECSGEQLGALFNIAVGIATLKDEVFFIDPYKEDDTYYYCNNKYKSNFKIEKRITRPLVKISKMKCVKDLNANQRRIIFPYTTLNNVASIVEEKTMIEQYPECNNYLQSVKDILATRGKGKSHYKPFYAYGRTQGLNKRGVKIYTPTFSQYPRFIFDGDFDSLFTNGYGIFYKETKTNSMDLFASVQNEIADAANVDVLIKVLNSGLMHFYVSKTSVSIDGGYPCYQKNFIERFSIPNMSKENISALRNMIDRDDIDRYLLNLYQINLPVPNLWA